MYPGLAVAVALAACSSVPAVRGVLLDWEGDAKAGQFSVRAADFRVHVFLFDERTTFEREGRQVSMEALVSGDRLEVTCHPQDAGLRRYALAVRVLEAASRAQAAQLPSWSSLLASNVWTPRGQLAVAGLVTEVHQGWLRLRQRQQQERIVALREDTRFIRDGLVVERPSLEVNTHVFIRAGRTADGQIEAYQVVWGRILKAR